MSDSCDSMDSSLPGSSVHGILQDWSGLPFPSPEDLPNRGVESGSPAFKQILYHLSYEGSVLEVYSKAHCFGKMSQCLLIVLNSSHFLSGIVSAQLIFLNLIFCNNVPSYGSLDGNTEFEVLGGYKIPSGMAYEI